MSKSPPIDHILANDLLMTKAPLASVLYDHLISDHFPVQIRLLASDFDVDVWSWPRKGSRLPMQPLHYLPFAEGGSTLVQWSERARKWLEQSYDAPVPPKDGVSIVKRRTTPPPSISHTYAALMKATRATVALIRCSRPSLAQRRSWARKICAIDSPSNMPLHHNVWKLLPVERRNICLLCILQICENGNRGSAHGFQEEERYMLTPE